MLDGRKMWITNGSIADVAVVWAQTDDGIRGFVVPTATAGFSAPRSTHKMSMRASVTSELVLDGVRLPADAVLPGVRGLGAAACLPRRGSGSCGDRWVRPASAFEARLAVRRPSASSSAGRSPASSSPSRSSPTCRSSSPRASCSPCTSAGSRTPGRLRPEQVSLGKLNNVREALEICRTARTILGANGISLEYPVIRHMNNLESVLTYEGTVEMHTLVVGQAITGQAAFR